MTMVTVYTVLLLYCNIKTSLEADKLLPLLSAIVVILFSVIFKLLH